MNGYMLSAKANMPYELMKIKQVCEWRDQGESNRVAAHSLFFYSSKMPSCLDLHN